MNNAYAITIDVDWAPDFMIDRVSKELAEAAVGATWFITHDSPAVQRLMKQTELFEFGLHPNFYPDSSHGTNPREIMSAVKQIVGESRLMRTHGLVQSSQLLELAMKEFGIEIDLSLFLPGTANICPHQLYLETGSKGLTRIPYFWEDEVEVCNPNPRWDINCKKYSVPGLKIFNFHPVHIYANTIDMTEYNKLKEQGPLQEQTEQSAEEFVNQSPDGPRDCSVNWLN